MVMKIEFGEDGDHSGPVEEMGLAARLGKKTKAQSKEKGENSSCEMFYIYQFCLDFSFCFDLHFSFPDMTAFFM